MDFEAVSFILKTNYYYSKVFSQILSHINATSTVTLCDNVCTKIIIVCL